VITTEIKEGSLATINRCVRISHVCEMTGMSRSSVYRKIAEGSFPKPFKLGERAVAWRVTVIESWIADMERR
jgi:prophage regulatory protein